MFSSIKGSSIGSGRIFEYISKCRELSLNFAREGGKERDMRRAVFALFVAMFVAPILAGEKGERKDERENKLPPMVRLAFTKHLQHLRKLDYVKQNGGKPEVLVRVASGSDAGHAYNVTGCTKTGELPATIYEDSNEYVTIQNLFGQGFVDDALVIIASIAIHEVCHGLGAADPKCYDLQIKFLQNEVAKRPSPIVDRVITNRLAQLAACEEGRLPGCEEEVSPAIPEIKASTSAH